MTRLPGWRVRRARPGRLHAAPASSSSYLERYAASFGAPVVDGHRRCSSVAAAAGDGYRVVTDAGTWRARHVVIATGPVRRAARPGRASARLARVVHG